MSHVYSVLAKIKQAGLTANKDKYLWAQTHCVLGEGARLVRY